MPQTSDQSQMPIEELLRTLKEQAQRRKRYRVWRIAANVTIFAFLLYAAIYAVNRWQLPASNARGFAEVAFGIIALIAASRTQKTAVKTLAQYDGVRTIGPLAEALTWMDAVVGDLAAEALERILPTVNADNAPSLNADELAALHVTLTPAATELRPGLAVAVIRALPFLGDVHSITPVRHLAENANVYPHVKAAATECLDAIRRRAELVRDANTLLRASEAPSAPYSTVDAPTA